MEDGQAGGPPPPARSQVTVFSFTRPPFNKSAYAPCVTGTELQAGNEGKDRPCHPALPGPWETPADRWKMRRREAQRESGPLHPGSARTKASGRGDVLGQAWGPWGQCGGQRATPGHSRVSVASRHMWPSQDFAAFPLLGHSLHLFCSFHLSLGSTTRSFSSKKHFLLWPPAASPLP